MVGSVDQELEFSKNMVGHKKTKQNKNSKVWFLGRAYRMDKKFDNRWVDFKGPIDIMDRSSNM